MKTTAQFLVVVVLAVMSAIMPQTQSVVIKVEDLAEKCDFSKCTVPDENKLNVHLVPHTHDDVGWLKTVDQYYYGSMNHYQKAGVQYILDTVVEELVHNKDRRFIYVETAFFWKWWQEQDEDTRKIVQELVKTGQLEFINGGWSMNDEATTHYNSIIDQMTWGLRRLKDTFGKCGVPKVTWQIDPFGHSREMANLFALMNYDAVYFAREDYKDHSNRRGNRTLEHVWQGSSDLGTAGDLFTGMMDMGYGPPRNMNWDLVGGGDEPVIDNPESEEYNVPAIVEKFVDYAKVYAKGYATNNIMFPVGTDFQFMDAHIYFKNMDKLIKHVNERQNEVKVFYSTPSCYTKAIHSTRSQFTSKNDDYFPYASDPHAYWTGYFSSRPALKRMERVGNNLLQACKQVDVLAANQGQYESNITRLREAMGIMQHHDAVSGTEKQHVTNDYAKVLQIGIDNCQRVLSNSYQKLMHKSDSPNSEPLTQVFCNQLNISSCSITESGTDLAVTLYNPLGYRLANQTVRIPVNGDKYYEVFCPMHNPVKASLVHIPDYVQKIPGRNTQASHELVFYANIPPLGFNTYVVKTSKTKTPSAADEVKKTKIVTETKLKSKSFDVVFDADGLLAELVLHSGEKVAFKNDFEFYKGMIGDNSNWDKRSSGAYIFRPQEQHTFSAANLVESNVYVNEKGVQEVHQRFDSYVEQVIRVDPTKEYLEFEYVVGPIPVADRVGKEVVARFQSDLKNNQTFYTDANGRQMLKRVWNNRPTWRLDVTEPVSGNYYPVNSRIYIRDEKRNLQLTVLNDRSQGGTSPRDGAIELMVHRRLLHDDAFGVGEALNEPGVDGKGLVIRGRHLVLLDKISDAASKHRQLGQELFLQPVVSFVAYTGDYYKNYQTHYSALNKPLPANVHLLTLEKWNGDDQYLLRLEHFYQRHEDDTLSKPVVVPSLKTLFKEFDIVKAEELTLGANQDVSAYKARLSFKYTPVGGPVYNPVNKPLDPETLEVHLNPMQIRTFLIQVKYHN